MIRINFKEIDGSIKCTGWFHFGKKEFECPGLVKEEIDNYKKTNRLPSPCDKCYKALIFWEGKYSKENVDGFFNMITSFEVNYKGKFNKGVVVFYFRDKNRMLDFLSFLENKMSEFNVSGKLQWRKACKEYQEQKPELWKNAKEFVPDLQPKTLIDF